MFEKKNARTRALNFLRAHPLAALSTINEDGTPHAAPIYVYADDDLTFYFIAETSTRKFTNLKHQPRVALTVADDEQQTTVQVTGRAELMSEPKRVDWVYTQLAKLRPKDDLGWLPPVTKVNEGEMMILELIPDWVRYADFKHHDLTNPKSPFVEVLKKS